MIRINSLSSALYWAKSLSPFSFSAIILACASSLTNVRQDNVKICLALQDTVHLLVYSPQGPKPWRHDPLCPVPRPPIRPNSPRSVSQLQYGVRNWNRSGVIFFHVSYTARVQVCSRARVDPPIHYCVQGPQRMTYGDNKGALHAMRIPLPTVFAHSTASGLPPACAFLIENRSPCTVKLTHVFSFILQIPGNDPSSSWADGEHDCRPDASARAF